MGWYAKVYDLVRDKHCIHQELYSLDLYLLIQRRLSQSYPVILYNIWPTYENNGRIITDHTVRDTEHQPATIRKTSTVQQKT